MEVVRRNAERIVQYLAKTDYVPGPRALVDPDPAALQRLDELYTLPASLYAFWETVGHINLITSSSCLEVHALIEGDPLEIHEVEFVLPLAEFAHEREESEFECPISADLVTKGGGGGGPGWFVTLPSTARDVRMRTAPGEPMFLDYLARSIANGGFASIQPQFDLEPADLLDELVASLEPVSFEP